MAKNRIASETPEIVAEAGDELQKHSQIERAGEEAHAKQEQRW